MTLVDQYQSRIIGPTETVDYSSVIMQAYPPQAIQLEPFVGFKVLCRDTNAHIIHPAERIRQIEANLGFMRFKGCLIRETSMQMPDGFWIITMPVPRSHVNQQLNNLIEVLNILEHHFGIVRQGLVEINVSGRCHITETERCLGGLTIPTRYMGMLVQPENTPYRLGHIIRINDNFMCLRTRWSLNPQTGNNFEELIVLSQIISSMYH